MICAKCGQEIPDGQTGCPQCDVPDEKAISGEKSSPKAALQDFGAKAKKFAINTGTKVKDISVSTAGKIHDTVDEMKEKAEQKSREKKEAEESKSAEEKMKDSVKLDKDLKDSIDEYNATYSVLNSYGLDLYVQRTRAVDLIVNIERLINSIANRPKSFDTDIQEIQRDRAEFKNACDYAEEELSAARKSATGAGAGVAAGAAIACVAPTAAMWIATTFGTASTGTAISALSGAAATKAALAWLGGGTLAMGGGGTAAGSAFLAMCGPVGWGLAGATLLTSVILFAANKVKLAKQKAEELEAVKRNTVSLKEVNAKIEILHKETISLRETLQSLYDECMSRYNCDFASIPDDDKMKLGTLVNNTKSLAALLGQSM